VRKLGAAAEPFPVWRLYKVYGDEIVVFIVAHLARKPEYWKRLLQRAP